MVKSQGFRSCSANVCCCPVSHCELRPHRWHKSRISQDSSSSMPLRTGYWATILPFMLLTALSVTLVSPGVTQCTTGAAAGGGLGSAVSSTNSKHLHLPGFVGAFAITWNNSFFFFLQLHNSCILSKAAWNSSLSGTPL